MILQFMGDLWEKYVNPTIPWPKIDTALGNEYSTDRDNQFTFNFINNTTERLK